MRIGKKIQTKEHIMNLIRYTPTRTYLPRFNHGSLLDELDRLFDAGFPTFREPARFGAFPVDVYHDKDSVNVRAELPGFRKEDLQVNVADDILTISGHFKTGNEKDAAQTETAIERTVALPENLDYQKVAAAYENGVLTVTLPKRAEAKPATVAIEVK
jgi:HSP20 family protein